jgi:hypothetical protein
MATVALVAWHPATSSVSFLWHNVIGAVVVAAVGTVVSLFTGAGAAPERA